MGTTIISVNHIAKAGYSVTFKDNVCQIRNKSDKIIGSIPVSQNGLYKVEKVYAAATSEERVNLVTLHRRLAHIAPDAIHKMVKGGAIKGIQLVDDGSTLVCEACEQAKATRKQIRKEREAPLAAAFGDEVHTDVWGPSSIPSLGRRPYYATFSDDYSCYTKLTVLQSKDETLDAYKAFAAWAHTQKGVKIKHLRSDHGGEYTGNAFTKFLNEQGTERRLTTHDTPQHNGVAEALNRRLVELVHTFRIQAGLPTNLWAEAAKHVIWLKNRTPTQVLGNVTPYERLTGPEWGQRVWVHDDSGSKLDKCATEARWVGYDEDSTHAHRIYWPTAHKVSVKRNVRFTSDTVTVPLPATSPSSSAPQPAPQQQPQQQNKPQNQPPQPVTLPPPATDSGEEEVEVEDELDGPPFPPGLQPVQQPVQPPRLPTRQSTRVRKPSALLQRIAAGEGTMDGGLDGGLFAYLADISLTSHADTDPEQACLANETVAAAIQEADPRFVQEARSRSDWPSWKAAMDREMETLKHLGTWSTVSQKINKNIISCKWVFKIK
jgi:hypothetical protein